MEYVVRMKDITKRFPRVVANDRVNLDIKEGEIHALVGENGAGKSTLMNVLYGLTKPDGGDLFIRGDRLPAETGFLGLDYGIGMIHQHFMLIGQFTALENIILGAEPRLGPMLDMRKARGRVERLMQEYGIEVDLDTRIDALSVGEEQRVEILRVLYRDASMIIMDEPTAVLTPQETRSLFSTLKMLTRSGRTVVFITHKLEEVMAIADTVTVMRAGSMIGTMPICETDVADLAEKMVGRRIEDMVHRKVEISARPVLKVEGVSLRSKKGQSLLTDISLEVYGGEIFGICGVDGNGQDDLFEVLIGLSRPTRGEVTFLGRDITHDPTSRRLKAGMAHIPPDRARMGLVADFTVKENLILGRHTDERFSGRVFLKARAVAESADTLVRDFGIEPPMPEMQTGLLSGGNQQKVIAARELSRKPALLIVAQPTRGLDIGAARMIHDLLVGQADSGRSVLLISADLSEIMKLADRIGVMYRGMIVGVVKRAEATEENLGLMMAGAKA
ncbi:MAG: ABC transporter ATP-binding protein [Candidatus Eisenbacteria bacterium]